MDGRKALSFLLLLPVLFLISDGASQQSSHFPGLAGEDGNVIVSWGIGRSVLEGSNGDNSSMILAKERTRRKDPKNNLEYYTGGWNISDDGYIYSVGYTSAPLIVIAAVWFVGFGLSLLLLCLCCCCCRRHTYGYSRTAYALSLILLSLFTIAAIVGSVVLYTGQGKFHGSTSDTLDYVVNQADITVDNLNNVSEYLAAAKNIRVNQVFLPSNVQNNIDNVDRMISSSAKTLDRETKKNSKDIQHVLDVVGWALIIFAAVMLLVALLGFIFSILGLQFLVYILVIIGWLLVTVTLILCGVFLVLHNLVIIGWLLVTVTLILCGVFLVLHNIMGDTCVAMDEWVQNPTAHTSLDDILPCIDNATAQATLTQSKDVTFQLVRMVNGFINNVSNTNPPPNLPPSVGFLSYNQSGPLVPTLCNPVNPDDTDRACATGEVDLSNATEIWKSYVCEVSTNNTCTTVGRLTPTMYNQMTSAVNVSYGLHQYSPFLVGLLDCTFVRDTFTGIHKEHCPDLRLYSKWIYIGLAMVSASVMLSLIFWVLYARERRHRKYTKLAMASNTQNSSGK